MKIYQDIDLTNFEFWSGAKDNAEMLTDDELYQIQAILEDEYPDGMDETELNDIFWFEDDFIAQCLGYDDYDQLWDERHRRTESRHRRMKESGPADRYSKMVHDKGFSVYGEEELYSVAEDGDGVAEYYMGNHFCYCLVPNCAEYNPDDKFKGDIYECIEYSIQKLVGAGYDAGEIYMITGATNTDYDDWHDTPAKSTGGYIDVGNGYFIGRVRGVQIVSCNGDEDFWDREDPGAISRAPYTTRRR